MSHRVTLWCFIFLSIWECDQYKCKFNVKYVRAPNLRVSWISIGRLVKQANCCNRPPRMVLFKSCYLVSACWVCKCWQKTEFSSTFFFFREPSLWSQAGEEQRGKSNWLVGCRFLHLLPMLVLHFLILGALHPPLARLFLDREKKQDEPVTLPSTWCWYCSNSCCHNIRTVHLVGRFLLASCEPFSDGKLFCKLVKAKYGNFDQLFLFGQPYHSLGVIRPF